MEESKPDLYERLSSNKAVLAIGVLATGVVAAGVWGVFEVVGNMLENAQQSSAYDITLNNG